MARPSKRIDLGELAAIRSTMNMAELAAHYECSEKSVQRALRRLEDQTPRAVLVNQAQMERAVEQNLNAVDEWQTARHEIGELLNLVEETGDLETRVQVIARHQKAIDQLIKLGELFHSWQAHQKFQEIVLRAIGEVAPDVRAKIETRLESCRALFIATGGPPRPAAQG